MTDEHIIHMSMEICGMGKIQLEDETDTWYNGLESMDNPRILHGVTLTFVHAASWD